MTTRRAGSPARGPSPPSCRSGTTSPSRRSPGVSRPDRPRPPPPRSLLLHRPPPLLLPPPSLVLLPPGRPEEGGRGRRRRRGGGGGTGGPASGSTGTGGGRRGAPTPAPAPAPAAEGTPWPSFNNPWSGRISMWPFQGPGGGPRPQLQPAAMFTGAAPLFAPSWTPPAQPSQQPTWP